MAGTRLILLVSMLLPLLVVIAPIAYHLTRVPRAALPLEAIAALDVASLEAALQAKLRDAERVTLWTSRAFATVPNAQLRVDALPAVVSDDLDRQLLSAVQAANLGGEIVVFVLCRGTDSSAPITMGSYRHGWTDACELSLSAQSELLHRVFRSYREPSIRVALKYRWSFSLLNEVPSWESASWAAHVSDVAMAYVEPLVAKLSALASFTLESQALHYARLAPDYGYDKATQTHFVTASDLQQFKSANDFATVSILHDREQPFHFMAALPSADHASLVIRPTATSLTAKRSFTIPGYGGVTILNPVAAPVDEVHRMMQVAVAQLRAALGLRSVGDGGMGLANWELDILVRVWLAKHWHTSLSAITSTAKLVDAMPQMTVLPRIQTQVDTTLRAIHATAAALHNQDGVWSAADCAAQLLALRAAVEAIEGTYYDSTMVAQLYFPEEHLYAVYLPLLLPLVLPFGFGLVREIKRVRVKRAAKVAE
ncbi:hypothetical protein SPRG_05730 [Saprolegnia parasitica CBS 223.65]|uniref:GPI transamidase component PIG-S n=1 Tax=Saprolegnia parasitica (strain CBS 223.65) TaxID=695850 RepID=A0A067CDM5_SAPPC|nr:hypothetical protein SPRG_05730 [Saprolegnia parasitica CBS 223.65]KDO28859.1 hypothetical protein SPRG_05730 [Saprolegnia parasitica CBS 223.65]|eukprot:XP_012200404.1 hypothetical protein SPRG_05730 [Saprolegnia parasitica CBS 223.65]